MMQSDSMKKTEVEGAANRFLTLARKALLDVQEPLAMANDNLKGDFTDFRTAEQVTTLMTAITQMFQGAQARIEAALPGLTALIREMQNADGADEKSAATMDDETMLAIADEIMNRYDDDFRALAE